MKIINHIHKLSTYKISQSVVAIGTFDGIHIGHRKILRAAKKKALKRNIPFIVLTFLNIPKEFINVTPINRIITLTKRYKLFNRLGVDYLCELDFSDSIRTLKPEDFIKNIIINELHANDIYVGYNFKFGYNKKGSVKTLISFENKYHYRVTIIDRVTYNNITVSSSNIRTLLKHGSVQDVKKLLQYYPFISGYVVKGNKRGRELGYPTVNIHTDEPPLFKRGVYATIIEIKKNLYKSVTNVGTRPTFEEENFTIETFIFNFDNTIYDKDVSVYFIDRIRNEKKYKNINELTNQISSDVKKAKYILRNVLRSKKYFLN